MSKRLAVVVACALMALGSSAAVAGPNNVDAFIDVLPPQAAAPGSGKFLSSGGSAEPMREVFVKTKDVAATRKAIEAAGGKVRVVMGSIITATVPASKVNEIAATAEYVQAATPMGGLNDVAVPAIGADEVHQGAGLPGPYKGRGTIVGIVDSGIDFTHPDFKDASGKSRILFIWDQKGTSGNPPSEIEGGYGTECGPEQIAAQSCPVNDPQGHGTHVAGIAAGADPVYGGVAPDANIIAVRYRSEINLADGYIQPAFSTNIFDAVYYIFKKAEAMGMPAVVNLSLGTHIGSHDGQTLLDQALDELVAGKPGRAIVASAGNENVIGSNLAGLHTGFDVAGPVSSNFEVLSFAQGRLAYLDIWEAPGSEIQIGLRATQEATAALPAHSEETGMVAPGDSKSGTLLGGKVSYVINAGETESALNGKPHVGISITFSDAVLSPVGLDFDLLASGSGHLDAWCWPDRRGSLVSFTTGSGPQQGAVYIPGDRRMSVTIPSTAKNVLSVSAYTTRNRFDNGAYSYQVPYPLNDILGYASVGPTANPTETGAKPDIAAPGALIASSKSKDFTPAPGLLLPDGRHVLMEGTSMAAPFVAGTVALMFSANPYLTPEDVRAILAQTATVDAQVGTAPNDRWGAGKLNSLEAVKATLASGIGPPSVSKGMGAEEGGGGKGSCALIAGVLPAAADPLSIIALALAGGLLLYLRKE